MPRLNSTARPRLTAAILACLLIALTSITAPARANDMADEGRKIIASLSDTVIAIVSNKTLSRQIREERFRAIFQRHFDLRAIGRWVMGRPWRQATPAERQEYLKYFEDYVIKVYTNQLQRYSGEQFKVVRTDRDGRGVSVTSNIVEPGGQKPIVVIWRMRPRKGGLKVMDVVIENISMSANQRREFAEVYRRQGNSVRGLINALKAKVTQLNNR